MARSVAIVAGTAAIAAVSTLGDFVWATWIPRHLPVYGVTHGVILFLCIGVFLGRMAGRMAAGALGGALLGGAAAGAFYALAPAMGYSAMFVVWVAVWVALGALDARLTRRHGPWARVFARGGIAAVLSGATFYLISGIWRPFDPEGWDYAVHFGAWIVAYLPGFATLLSRRD